MIENIDSIYLHENFQCVTKEYLSYTEPEEGTRDLDEHREQTLYIGHRVRKA